MQPRVVAVASLVVVRSGSGVGGGSGSCSCSVIRCGICVRSGSRSGSLWLPTSSDNATHSQGQRIAAV